jgi:hypothetical protein
MKKLLLAAAIAAISISITGCFKPPNVADLIPVKPNETAWLIPLDGSSQDGQVKFNSVSFLDQHKIALKRITINKTWRKTGYDWEWWAGEWIPVAQLITVDRSLVTREWTDDPNTGTSSSQQGVGVVTADSVKLRVGLTITASINEDDASTYLYYHGQKELKDVLDQNIRSFAVAELTREYSQLGLKEAQTNGSAIYAKLFSDARETFKMKGITIQYLGNSEGLTYADKSVQESINASYKAEQDNRTAQMEQAAQVVRNTTKVLNAQADADAASKLFSVQEAAKFNNSLQIALLSAQAKMAMATKWNGSLPANILPESSPLLLNMGAGDASATAPAK